MYIARCCCSPHPAKTQPTAGTVTSRHRRRHHPRWPITRPTSAWIVRPSFKNKRHTAIMTMLDSSGSGPNPLASPTATLAPNNCIFHQHHPKMSYLITVGSPSFSPLFHLLISIIYTCSSFAAPSHSLASSAFNSQHQSFRDMPQRGGSRSWWRDEPPIERML